MNANRPYRRPLSHLLAGVLLALALAPAALASPALAAPASYLVVPERSKVLFRFTENGAPRLGEFEAFAGSGTFDHDAPADARLEFRVESNSIDLGSRLVEGFAQTGEWFDSAAHPLVTYRLTHLEPVSPERYIAEGVLSIRGRERAVSAPIHLVFGEREVHATGDLRVDREAYGLGMGASRAFVDIGREVSVLFDLIARPAQ